VSEQPAAGGEPRHPLGVLLMTFGSAVTSADVPAYLHSVRGGRDASPELVAEFERRFDVIGRSPLLEITAAQAEALQAELDSRNGSGACVVAVGMLHSAPSVADGLAALVRASVRRVVGIVLAPQYSPMVLSGYIRAVEAAAVSAPGIAVTISGSWHLGEGWITSLRERLDDALAILGERRDSTGIVFTAHSLPRPVLERDPAYLDQIHDTVEAVAAAAGLAPAQWRFAFQSAGHTPEEWLTPDLLDVLPDLATEGCTDVVVVPVQFVADHLEVLYDIDVAAAEQARDAGLAFHRIAMPNAAPRFIDALADVVSRESSLTPV
jgi:ferrochelatase